MPALRVLTEPRVLYDLSILPNKAQLPSPEGAVVQASGPAEGGRGEGGAGGAAGRAAPPLASRPPGGPGGAYFPS